MQKQPKVKILYLNVTQKTNVEKQAFTELAEQFKLPGTEVHIASLPETDGRFRNAEYRTYEAIMTRGVVRAARAAARENFDAMAIGCFYDIALHDAREISGEMLVSASCEAACEIANHLANRFGVIVGRRKWVYQMEGLVRSYGYSQQLAGFYPVDLGVTDFQRDHAETRRRLIAAGRTAVERDYAEALILGCTMEMGFYKSVEDATGVPVIDAAIAALKRAEYGALLKRQCGWIPSRKWSCEPPPEEELEQLRCLDEREALGPRIVVAADR
ncbi:aspartate/glutamate racemase family protein [Paraburkholderia sp. BL21I4N1]|uniref:aspartate/glutamate racemase family protein n=1 Tax=Paraburkholderia sp. BL21I4N1 TaxID=1938801 RepID=UPI000D48905F|nr:aspartate/glutamate racemase family protein [Paraburkholderia sp. BL21I4N1]PQV44169.1 allantoin racemase [Paraburkholderia sp. BL21I4N1]